ncbi:hypothetical protein BJ138DRAFT_1186261 [Hygrophoropsis aurantiaca]|uniref:Uncharacterized protein n=1 Tax=Hygrophoropsis aurantiaca TaxID=72124 RepID=A0ACB8AEI9_9AGAM|nr:hypothetical protein BJ138DRAFT_1186261 [Hygrophoropsis aurantiaca]
MSGHHYQIEVIQFWRGKNHKGYPYPLHWAIFIPTSPGRGHTYEVLGNIDSFTFHSVRDAPHHSPTMWRGSFTAGYVPITHLSFMEEILRRVPIVRSNLDWNCQNWVSDALGRLRMHGLSINSAVSHSTLRTEMFQLLEAWETGEI